MSRGVFLTKNFIIQDMASVCVVGGWLAIIATAETLIEQSTFVIWLCHRNILFNVARWFVVSTTPLAAPFQSSSGARSISRLSFSLTAVSLLFFLIEKRQELIRPSLLSLDLDGPRAGLLAMLS